MVSKTVKSKNIFFCDVITLVLKKNDTRGQFPGSAVHWGRCEWLNAPFMHKGVPLPSFCLLYISVLHWGQNKITFSDISIEENNPFSKHGLKGEQGHFFLRKRTLWFYFWGGGAFGGRHLLPPHFPHRTHLNCYCVVQSRMVVVSETNIIIQNSLKMT